MNRFLMTLSVLGLLTACGDGQPFEFTNTGPTTPTDPDAPDTPDPNIIPAALSSDLAAVAYNPSSDLLQIDMSALDADGGGLVTYARNANLDVPGYEAYSYQDDPLDRMFVAVVAESPDGAVEAIASMDGGQFTKYFGGTYFGRNIEYTPGSTTGLVSYAGKYAGLSNLDSEGAELLPTGADPAIAPAQSAQVTGDIFFNVDFGDGVINGAIYNREWVNLNATTLADLGTSDLPDVFLIPADVSEGGTFDGEAQDGAQLVIGSYGGIFGGDTATAVAGSVFLQDYLEDVDGENEYGIFVLVQCGLPDDDAICDSL